jgi:hypothetical protein
VERREGREEAGGGGERVDGEQAAVAGRGTAAAGRRGDGGWKEAGKKRIRLPYVDYLKKTWEWTPGHTGLMAGMTGQNCCPGGSVTG